MWCDWNSNQEIWRGVAMLRGWNHTKPTFWWFLGTCLGSCSNDHAGPVGLFWSFFAASLSKSWFGSPWKLEIDVMPTFQCDWTDGKTKWKIHFFCLFSGRITFSQFQFSREICKQLQLYHFPIFHSLHCLGGFTPKCIMDFMEWIIQHIIMFIIFHPWPLVSLVFDNAMSQLAIARAHRLCCRTAVAGVAGLVWGGERCSKSHRRSCHGCHWPCHTTLLLGHT